MKLPKRLRAAAFVGLSMIALALPSLPGPALAPAQAADPQPNILIVLTDDQPPDTMMVMPKTVQFFGDGGTDFPNGSVTTLSVTKGSRRTRRGGPRPRDRAGP